MSLQYSYQRFLASPNPSLLTDETSLHLITTLVTIDGPIAIVKHFKDSQIKFKEHKFLDVVEGSSSLAVIVETTVEFVTGGGPYLPGLDDNFVADHTVTLPIISQIRLSWDQGCLLKLIDVIGKTGRNWPIRDGKDQIKLIASSSSLAQGKTIETGDTDDCGVNGFRSRKNTSNPIGDPHASLCLFTPRDQKISEQIPAITAHRPSARPSARDYVEIFGSEETEPASPVSSPRNIRGYRKKTKSKAGDQNFAPSRLFDVEEKTQSKSIDQCKNPAKFKHFEFSNGAPNEEKKTHTAKVKSNKHENHWDFDDFVTPQKNIPSRGLRSNDVRHWGNSDDEVIPSPERIKKVDKPRKDAETHFEFEERDSQENEIRIVSRPRGQGQNNGSGLYKDIFDKLEENEVEEHKPYTRGVAIMKDRQKDFEAHFTMTDKSPGLPNPEKLPEDRAKSVKMMDANWSSYDKSPTQQENKLGSPAIPRNCGLRPLIESTNNLNSRNETQRGIKTFGDGMGGRKTGESSWVCGEFDDDEKEAGLGTQNKYRTGRQGGRKQASNDDFWDFC